MIRTIHPFPARMAPDLAIGELNKLKKSSRVLDPMTGSGTVVRHASDLGHRAIAFDKDPLAVLLTRVWTNPVDDTVAKKMLKEVMESVRGDDDIKLNWIDDDYETSEFVDYWFGKKQKQDLRRIALALSNRSHLRMQNRIAVDVLRLALSRIIITKTSGASLARDVSHSRPHKVAEESDYDVISAYEKSVHKVLELLINNPPKGNTQVNLGDARSLRPVANKTIDLILTSPPYLNAIDYMRGHRLSLVWLGYRIQDLRAIKRNSIGSERSTSVSNRSISEIMDSMGSLDGLASRQVGMIKRYANDTYRLMAAISRVLKNNGRAVMVVGNSCLKGAFIRNSDGVIKAAEMAGLKLVNEAERELPTRNRYLPVPVDNNPLSKRMRTENVLTFTPM